MSQSPYSEKYTPSPAQHHTDTGPVDNSIFDDKKLRDFESGKAVEIGKTVLKFIETLPPEYNEPVRQHLTRPLFIDGPSYLTLMEKFLISETEIDNDKFSITKKSGQPAEHGVQVNLEVVDKHSNNNYYVSLTTGLKEQAGNFRYDHQVICDVFTDEGLGHKLTAVYEPGSKFGSFIVSDYDLEPDPDNDMVTQKTEHIATCQCVGDIVDKQNIYVPPEFSDSSNRREMLELGKKVINFFKNPNENNPLVAELLTTPWGMMSDFQIIDGVLNCDQSDYMTKPEWEEIYYFKPPITKLMVTPIGMSLKNKLEFTALVPSHLEHPSKYIESNVTVQKKILPNGAELASIELNRGGSIDVRARFVTRHFDRVTLEVDMSANSGQYKCERYPMTTGQIGIKPSVHFFDNFSKSSLVSSNLEV